jgi:hypothetical protein
MDDVTEAKRLEAIRSIQSTIRKCEKALVQMTRKGANSAVLRSRLNALNVGLAMLEDVWDHRPHRHSREELAEAREVLEGLFPSMKAIHARSRAGGPQKTLLERRLKALDLVVRAIDEHLSCDRARSG